MEAIQLSLVFKFPAKMTVFFVLFSRSLEEVQFVLLGIRL